MGYKDSWEDKIHALGRLTCDLSECLNKRDGSAYKTTFFGHLGPMVETGEHKYHIKCLERKQKSDYIKKHKVELPD